MRFNLILGLFALAVMLTAAILVAAASWQDRKSLKNPITRFHPFDIRESALGMGSIRGKVEARGPAKSAKGTRRTVTTTLHAGDAIFVAGEVQLQDCKLVVKAPANQNLILESFDPRGNLARQATVVAVFILAELLGCALCTALALWPPAFDTISRLGAVLCLAFFLGVTPIGIGLHDWSQPPDCVPLHGEWTYALDEQPQPERLIVPT